MNIKRLWAGLGISAAAAVALVGGAFAQEPPSPTSGTLLAEGFAFTLGGTAGPDGACYVADAGLGSISSVGLEDGAVTTIAEGLPASEEGGVTDIVFLDGTLYALTTTVEPDAATGIYRIEEDGSATLIADLGAFSNANPPLFGESPYGNPFAIDVLDGAFLVTDGNHNRLLHATLEGEVTEVIAWDNIVPTGIETDEGVYVTFIGPFPHTPETGMVKIVDVEAGTSTDIASGISNIIDVEFGEDGALYALSLGDAAETNPADDPAEPFTGKLLLVNDDGSFSVLVDNLLFPTSIDFIGDTACIVSLAGQVWRVDGVSTLDPLPEPTPTAEPTAEPTEEPTPEPTEEPTPEPTAEPTTAPTEPPTATPATAPPAPPATGSGTASAGEGTSLWLLGVALALLTTGTALAIGRRIQNR